MSVSLEELRRVVEHRKSILDQARRRSLKTGSPEDQATATAQMHKLDGLLSAVPFEHRRKGMLPRSIEVVAEMSPRLIEAKADKAFTFFINRNN